MERLIYCYVQQHAWNSKTYTEQKNTDSKDYTYYKIPFSLKDQEVLIF